MKPSKGLEKIKRAQGRPPRIVVQTGMVFGHLRIIKKVTDNKSGNTWLCRCIAPSGPNGSSCGTQMHVRQHYILRQPNPKTSCGCMTYIGANPYKREKVIWQMMNRRCLYPTHVSYKYYGGAGIKPCPDWIETNPDGFKNFVRDMGPAPSMKHTLERLDPFYGYAPFKEVIDPGTGEVTRVRQCVWATMDAQANNKRSHHIARARAAENAKRIAGAKDGAE